jgi:hypothetical protein
MKIFGVGANRSGTATLTEVLEVLGYKISHWDHHFEISRDLINNKFDFEFLTEYDGATDLPIPSIYKNLDQTYPNSKFILTKRDPEDWIKSIENHITRDVGLEIPVFEHFLMYGDYFFNKKLYLKRYNEHNASVEKYFKNRKEDLLVIDLTKVNKWQPFCEFLDLEIPSTKFPHKNKTQNYNMAWKIKRKMGLQ